VGPAIDEYDLVGGLEHPSQAVRGGDTAETAAEDQDAMSHFRGLRSRAFTLNEPVGGLTTPSRRIPALLPGTCDDPTVGRER